MTTKSFNTAVLTATVLCATQLTTTGATAVYTVPASGCAKVTAGSVCNTSTTASVNVTVSIKPSGATARNIIAVLPLAAGDSLALTPYLAGHMLGDGDAIYVTAGTANVLDVVITGAVGA